MKSWPKRWGVWPRYPERDAAVNRVPQQPPPGQGFVVYGVDGDTGYVVTETGERITYDVGGD